jgi:hypothetical protein
MQLTIDGSNYLSQKRRYIKKSQPMTFKFENHLKTTILPRHLFCFLTPFKMQKTLLFILLIVTFQFAENCDKRFYKKIYYTKQVKHFKSSSVIDKVILFKSLVDTFSSSPYTHFTNSCLYLKQEYQIKSINKFYKTLKKIKNDSLLIAAQLTYSDYLISYGKKLTKGPFEGDSIDIRIANEIKCLSKSDRIFEEAIYTVKSIKNWEQKALCTTILNLEIIRCGLYMKVSEAFKSNIPLELIQNTDGTSFKMPCYQENEEIGMTENCFERLTNEYGKYDCFKNIFKEIISNKLKNYLNNNDIE